VDGQHLQGEDRIIADLFERPDALLRQRQRKAIRGTTVAILDANGIIRLVWRKKLVHVFTGLL
jgi:hypothetical protein